MKIQITTEEARNLLNKHIKERFNLEHLRESEVIMRALAKHFGEDEDLWGITGLLHDLDWEEIKNDHSKHGLRTCEILKEEGYEIPKMFDAIKSHCGFLGYTKTDRNSKLDYALCSAENLTGIIYAYVLMRPDKDINNVEVKSIKKKLKDKKFAANVNRDYIKDIEETSLSLDEFLQIAIDAMKTIKDEITV